MIRRIGFAVLCMGLLPAGVWGAELGAYGTTLFRFSQQSMPGTATKKLAPATQYLGVDAGGLADGNLSFHLYGWGRQDLADESTAEGKNAGNVSYGYLRYRFPTANGMIRAGRFFVVEGVANEQVDGAGFRADLPAGFSISLYGGAPAVMDVDNDNRGDYIVGGRIASHLAGKGEIGISVLGAGNSLSRRIIDGTTLETIENQRRLVGGDIWLSPVQAVSLNGRTSYSTVTSSIAEHDYTLSLKPLTDMIIAGSYNERRMKGLYAGTNLPFLFEQFSGDKSSVYGGSITVAALKNLELFADYRHTKRDSYGSSDRYGLEARLVFPDDGIKCGIGYHRIDAPDITIPMYPPYSYGLSHHQLRSWIVATEKEFTTTIDAIGHLYDDKDNPNLNGETVTYELITSVAYRISSGISLSGDVSYAATPLYTNRFTGLVRAEFSFDTNSKGGSK